MNYICASMKEREIKDRCTVYSGIFVLRGDKYQKRNIQCNYFLNLIAINNFIT